MTKTQVGLREPGVGHVLTQVAARDLTDQIRTGMETVWHLIRAAYQGRAWEALGYHTWDEYVTREFGNLYLRPPLEERQDVVMSLREAGMSSRAIASATQLSQATVVRELRGAGESNESPDAPGHRVVGMDGKMYQARQDRGEEPGGRMDPAEASSAPTQTVADGDVLDMPAEAFGVAPLDLGRRAGDEQSRASRALAAFNGGGSAAVPVLLKAAQPVTALVSPLTGQSPASDEDLHGVVWDSARCVRTLAHLLKAVGHHEGQSTAEIRTTLRDAVDDLETVLEKIEEVI